ncbi:MAG: hypothetical protein HY782_24170 [Chloroflexi bacterium]|nr:hypothetical protein [Chloroflexota bacterium]
MESSLAEEMGTLAQANRIAQTKLRPPRLSGDHFARPQLLTELRFLDLRCTPMFIPLGQAIPQPLDTDYVVTGWVNSLWNVPCVKRRKYERSDSHECQTCI